MLSLYPDIEPYQTHLFSREKLSHGGQHQIYVEECGNPNGLPVVFLHGGPGSGCRPQHRRYFDPEKYRIILFDSVAADVLYPVANWKITALFF